MSLTSSLRPPGTDDGISSARVDVAIARIASGFGALFFVLSLVPLAEQARNLTPVWTVSTVAILSVGLVIPLIGSFLGWRSSWSAMTVAVAYPLAALSWPMAVVDPAAAPVEGFWLQQILVVALVMAVISLPLAGTVLYVVLVPVLVASVRVLPAGGGARIDLVVLDAVQGIVIGGLIAIFSATIRDAAASVDRARHTALVRYAQAVREHAAEVERVAVDAIVHDSVLTTLLTASRADGPDEYPRVVEMSESAIRRLDDARRSDPSADDLVTSAALAARLRGIGAALVPPVPVRVGRLPDHAIPRRAAEALVSAAEQAMMNSLQHAGDPAERWAILRESGSAFELEVGDTGIGFDPAAVPIERLGVRLSIIDRVTSAGGRAEVLSTPEGGTRVVLHWPDDAAPAGPHYAEFEAAAEAEIDGTRP